MIQASQGRSLKCCRNLVPSSSFQTQSFATRQGGLFLVILLRIAWRSHRKLEALKRAVILAGGACQLGLIKANLIGEKCVKITIFIKPFPSSVGEEGVFFFGGGGGV